MGERVNVDLVDAIHHARELQINSLIKVVSSEIKATRVLSADDRLALDTIFFSEPGALAAFAIENPDRYEELIEKTFVNLKNNGVDFFVVNSLLAIQRRITDRLDCVASVSLEVNGAIIIAPNNKLPDIFLERLPVLVTQIHEAGIQEIIKLLCKKPIFKMAKSFAIKSGLPYEVFADGSSEVSVETVIPFVKFALLYKPNEELPECIIYIQPPSQ